MQGAPIVTLEPSTATMDPRENYNEHLAEVQMRTMMHPEFLKALEEGIEEDE